MKLDIMKAVLKFVYTGMVEKMEDGEKLEELFKAAHVTMLDGLKKICEASLIAGVTTANSIQMMALGHLYEVEELKEKAKQVFLEAGG